MAGVDGARLERVESQDEHQQQEEAPVLIPGAVGGHRVIHPIGQVVMSSQRSNGRVIRPLNGQHRRRRVNIVTVVLTM